MTEVQIWVLTGLVTFFIAVLMVLFRNWLGQQGKLLAAIQELEKAIVLQNQQLKTLFNERINNRAEIKEIESRVRELEKNRFRCKNYAEL